MLNEIVINLNRRGDKIEKLGRGLVLFILIFLYPGVFAQERAMTFNIRYNNPNDQENCWKERKLDVVEMINHYQPAILGIQEGLVDQVSFLDDHLPNHCYIGVGRDDGKTSGEYTAIFYDTTKFDLLKSATFWLSETPMKVSVGWDASMERISTYGSFSYRLTGDTLWVFNAHFDHIGKKARKNSAELILRMIGEHVPNHQPLIVIGDFNSKPTEPPIQALKSKLEDAYDASISVLEGPVGTFNGFNTTNIPTHRIDYIFIKNLVAETYKVVDDKRGNGLHLSDHFAVVVDFNMR